MSTGKMRSELQHALGKPEQCRVARDEAYDLLTCARPAEHLEGATDEEWYAARAAWYARNGDADPKPFGVLGQRFGEISGEAANAQKVETRSLCACLDRCCINAGGDLGAQYECRIKATGCFTQGK